MYFDFFQTIIILCSPVKSLYSYVLNSNTVFGKLSVDLPVHWVKILLQSVTS